MKKKLISLLLAAILLISVVPVAHADNIEAGDNATLITNISLEDMLAANISKVLSYAASQEYDLPTPSAVKALTDFAGNGYYLVEFEPSGYLICHAETGEMVEYSATAPSPFLGETANLIYGGPTYYYLPVVNGNDTSFIHTVTQQSIPSDATAALTAMAEDVDSIANEIEANATTQVVATSAELAEIANGTFDITGINMSLGFPDISTESVSYISSSIGALYNDLNTSTEMGFLSGGVCGYVSCGLLSLWADHCCAREEFINDFAFLNNTGDAFNGPNFTRLLRYTFGSHSGSTPTGSSPSGQALTQVMNDYMDDYYLSGELVTKTTVTISGIIDDMKNNSAPVLIAGNVYDYDHEFREDPSDLYVSHIITAYGYTSGNGIVCHYGWPDREEVVLMYSTLYETMQLLNPGALAVSINDVPSSNWAYTAAQYCARYHIIELTSGYFFPNNTATRGTFVNALYQLVGAPNVENSSEYSAIEDIFDDITTSHTYYNAARWAYSQGILTGVNATTIGLDRTLTREQVAVFMQRFASEISATLSPTDGPSASSFADYGSVSSYAQAAMDWATRRYIISGSNGNLNPQSSITRAQVAQVVYNFAEHTISKYFNYPEYEGR